MRLAIVATGLLAGCSLTATYDAGELAACPSPPYQGADAGCRPERDFTFCKCLSPAGGPTTGIDNCGLSRSVADCTAWTSDGWSEVASTVHPGRWAGSARCRLLHLATHRACSQTALTL